MSIKPRYRKDTDKEQRDSSGGMCTLWANTANVEQFKIDLYTDELKKLKPLLTRLFQAFDEQKGELIERYGDRDDENKLIQPEPNAFQFTKRAMEFKVEYDKFMELESEILFKRLPLFSQKMSPIGIFRRTTRRP